MDGIEATCISTTKKEIKVLILTVFGSEEKAFKSIKAGAAGYLLKDTKLVRILSAIEEVMQGCAAMSAGIAAKSLTLLRAATKNETMPSSSDYDLSIRETELLALLVKGNTYQQIADRLYISHGHGVQAR